MCTETVINRLFVIRSQKKKRLTDSPTPMQIQTIFLFIAWFYKIYSFQFLITSAYISWNVYHRWNSVFRIGCIPIVCDKSQCPDVPSSFCHTGEEIRHHTTSKDSCCPLFAECVCKEQKCAPLPPEPSGTGNQRLVLPYFYWMRLYGTIVQAAATWTMWIR